MPQLEISWLEIPRLNIFVKMSERLLNILWKKDKLHNKKALLSPWGAYLFFFSPRRGLIRERGLIKNLK